MKKIAIITARGGSKRIPRKNIKLFCGKPIIAYSIEAAINSRLFDVVMVSTEDIEIAEIAKKYGATVPFMRSLKTSDDFATTKDVLVEVINKYRELGVKFDSLCCIYPTAALITPEVFQKSFEKFSSNNYDSLIPVVQYSVPIQIALHLGDNDLITMINPQYDDLRTQDMPQTFFDPGQFYWAKIGSEIEKLDLFNKNTGSYIISELIAQDIDNLEDWQIAEFKYRYFNESK